jgi:hypothetical protein
MDEAALQLQEQARIARQDAERNAAACAKALRENQDLISQLSDSNAAYDRMAEQVERTAYDLRSLLSGSIPILVSSASHGVDCSESSTPQQGLKHAGAGTCSLGAEMIEGIFVMTSCTKRHVASVR